MQKGTTKNQALPGCVPPELLDLKHAGVLPEGQLVLAEPVGRHELLVVSRPLQGAHLKTTNRANQ